MILPTALPRASLLSPFGLATTGWIVNDTASIVASPTHPIALGPGGPLTQFDLHNTGWLTSLGPYAHTIAIETATGMPVMAAIEQGAISPTSGRAVFLTDSSVFDDGFVYGPVLAANLVGYLVPEPGLAPQAVLAILGFATFVGVCRRNARRVATPLVSQRGHSRHGALFSRGDRARCASLASRAHKRIKQSLRVLPPRAADFPCVSRQIAAVVLGLDHGELLRFSRVTTFKNRFPRPSTPARACCG